MQNSSCPPSEHEVPGAALHGGRWNGKRQASSILPLQNLDGIQSIVYFPPLFL